MIGPRGDRLRGVPPSNVMTCAQVNRPLSMKKDGIQTRKRKPKSMGGGHGGVARPGGGPLAGEYAPEWPRGPL